MDKNRPKRPALSLRVTKSTMEALDEMALRNGLPRAAMAEELLVEALQNANFDAEKISERDRAAEKESQKVIGRLMKAVRREVEAILDEK